MLFINILDVYAITAYFNYLKLFLTISGKHVLTIVNIFHCCLNISNSFDPNYGSSKIIIKIKSI